MLTQALAVSLRIIVLRAGPEDFPYDPAGRLNGACLLFALLAYALFLAFVLPPAAAAMTAAAMLAAIWLVTRLTLASRKLENRFQQTFNAQLATSALLTLAMIPAFAKLAPAVLEMYQQIKLHPELANQPDKWPKPSPAASLLSDLLMVWQLVVSARIYGRAANVGPLGGVAIAVLGALAMLLMMLFFAPLIGVFLR